MKQNNLSPSQTAVGVSAETAPPGDDPSIVYGPEIDIAEIVDEETLQLLDIAWDEAGP